jgi:hypothetical protein
VIVLPFRNTENMTLHLTEIVLAVAPSDPAAFLIDQSGWHITDKLDFPSNILDCGCEARNKLSISLGVSWPSGTANGLMGHDHCRVV